MPLGPTPKRRRITPSVITQKANNSKINIKKENSDTDPNATAVTTISDSDAAASSSSKPHSTKTKVTAAPDILTAERVVVETRCRDPISHAQRRRMILENYAKAWACAKSDFKSESQM